MSIKAVASRKTKKAIRQQAKFAFDEGLMSPDQRYWYSRRRTTGNLSNRNSKQGRTAHIATSVYVIGSNFGFVKIGTSIDVEKRFSGLSTAVPFEIELIGSVEFQAGYDARWVEYFSHKILRRFHAKGEWFKCQIETAVKAVNFSCKAWEVENGL